MPSVQGDFSYRRRSYKAARSGEVRTQSYAPFWRRWAGKRPGPAAAVLRPPAQLGRILGLAGGAGDDKQRPAGHGRARQLGQGALTDRPVQRLDRVSLHDQVERADHSSGKSSRSADTYATRVPGWSLTARATAVGQRGISRTRIVRNRR